MKRNKRRKRKVFDLGQVRVKPARLGAGVLLRTWAVWSALTGLLTAFGMIATLYMRWRIPDWVWIDLWPPSTGLLTATGLTPRRELLLAYGLAAENAVVYALVGTLLGVIHITLRPTPKST